jgi:hypothetical protein
LINTRPISAALASVFFWGFGFPQLNSWSKLDAPLRGLLGSKRCLCFNYTRITGSQNGSDLHPGLGFRNIMNIYEYITMITIVTIITIIVIILIIIINTKYTYIYIVYTYIIIYIYRESQMLLMDVDGMSSVDE